MQCVHVEVAEQEGLLDHGCMHPCMHAQVDLMGAASMLTLAAPAPGSSGGSSGGGGYGRVEMHDLMLVDLTAGPSTTYPLGLLMAGLWFFDFQ